MKTRSGGLVVMLVNTTPEGGPSGCKAMESSDPRVGEGTCELALSRARFKAPLDEDGQPMASHAVLPVRWSP